MPVKMQSSDEKYYSGSHSEMVKPIHRKKDLNPEYRYNLADFMMEIQDRQDQYIMKVKDSPEPERLKERIKYTKDALRMSMGPMRMGARPSSLAYAISSFTMMSLANPTIREDLPATLYDMIMPYAQALDRMFPGHFNDFLLKCRTGANGGRPPYTPETAAMDIMALDIKRFEEIREARAGGASNDEIDIINSSFEENTQRVLRFSKLDGVPLDDIDREYDKVFVNMFMRYPLEAEANYNIFSEELHDVLWPDDPEHLKCTVREDLVEKISSTESYYVDWNGETRTGFSYVVNTPDGKLDANTLYTTRSIFTVDDYVDGFAKTMHGAFRERMASGDSNAPIVTEEGQKSLRLTAELERIMRQEGFTNNQVLDILERAQEQCYEDYVRDFEQNRESYYRAGREQAKKDAQTNRSSQSGNDRAQTEYDTDSRVHRTKEDNEKDSSERDHEDAVRQNEESVKDKTLRVQPGCQIGPDADSINVTFDEKDAAAMAKLCAQLHYDIAEHTPDVDRIDDIDDLASKYLYEMKQEGSGVAQVCRTLMDSLNDDGIHVSDAGRDMADIMQICLSTDAPAVLSDGTTVATRTLHGNLMLGETGARLDGKSSIGPGCFVHDSVQMSNVRIESPSGKPLYVSMSSKLQDCVIQGDGVIANSHVKDCSVYGTFDPYKTRKELGLSRNIMKTADLGAGGQEFFGHDVRQSDKVNPVYMSSLKDYWMTKQRGQNSANMRLAKFWNDLDDIEGRAVREARKTPGRNDDKTARKVAETLGREGYQSNVTIKSLLQQADDMLDKAAGNDGCEFG